MTNKGGFFFRLLHHKNLRIFLLIQELYVQDFFLNQYFCFLRLLISSRFPNNSAQINAITNMNFLNGKHTLIRMLYRKLKKSGFFFFFSYKVVNEKSCTRKEFYEQYANRLPTLI